MAKTPTAAAVYCRISLDRSGEAAGVERQEFECRALADRLGWTVAEVYIDNDISASAYSKKPRPEFERMLEDLRAGVRDAVIVKDEDRLVRRMSELEGFISLADELGVKLANVSGEVNLSTATGRLQARIKGSVAAHESDQKSERIKSQRAQLARNGEPHYGPRPYGYTKDQMSVVASEAAVIREVVARFIAGESAYALAADLNARGIRNSRGKAWSARTLRDMIASPRYAAKRVHQGVVVSDAVWPAIVDPQTSELVRLRLATTTRPAGRHPVHLLTGLLTCGGTLDGEGCGRTLHSTSMGGSRGYGCNDRRQPACNSVGIMAHLVEPLITEAVVSRYEGVVDRVWRADPGGADLSGLFEELKEYQRRLDEVGVMFAEGEIDRRQLSVATAKIREGMGRTRSVIRSRGHTDVLASVPEGQSVRDRWDVETVEWRRAFIRAAVDSIIVKPTGHRGSKFDPERVEITYR